MDSVSMVPSTSLQPSEFNSNPLGLDDSFLGLMDEFLAKERMDNDDTLLLDKEETKHREESAGSKLIYFTKTTPLRKIYTTNACAERQKDFQANGPMFASKTKKRQTIEKIVKKRRKTIRVVGKEREKIRNEKEEKERYEEIMKGIEKEKIEKQSEKIQVVLTLQPSMERKLTSSFNLKLKTKLVFGDKDIHYICDFCSGKCRGNNRCRTCVTFYCNECYNTYTDLSSGLCRRCSGDQEKAMQEMLDAGMDLLEPDPSLKTCTLCGGEGVCSCWDTVLK